MCQSVHHCWLFSVTLLFCPRWVCVSRNNVPDLYAASFNRKKPLCQATPSDMTEGVFVCVCCVNTAKQGQQAFILSNWWTPPPFFCCKINTDTFFGEAFLFLLTAPCGKLRSGSSIFSACVLFFLPLSLTIYLMYALSTPRNAILCKIFSSFEITRVHWPQSTGYL